MEFLGAGYRSLFRDFVIIFMQVSKKSQYLIQGLYSLYFNQNYLKSHYFSFSIVVPGTTFIESYAIILQGFLLRFNEGKLPKFI